MLKTLKEGVRAFSRGVDIISPFHLEADKLGSLISLLVYEVSGVMEFSTERVRVKCRIGSLTVLGEELLISAYERRTIEIIGKIRTVEFNYAKN